MKNKGWQWFGFVLKLAVASGIVWFLLSQGKLDWHLLLAGAVNPWVVVVGLIPNLTMVSMSGLRWQCLLRSQGIVLPFPWVHRMAYVTMFFNLMVPGAIGGDALRIGYVTRLAPSRRAAAVLTIVLDRFGGLYSLLMICVGGVLFNLTTVLASAPLSLLGLSAVIFVLAVPLSAILLLWLAPRIPWVRNRVQSPPTDLLSRIIHQLMDAMRFFRQGKRWVLLALIISIFQQVIEIMAIVWIAYGLGMMVLPVKTFFLSVPWSWVANIIPISPGGLGVGEAAFDQICRWFQSTPTLTAFGTIFLINRLLQMVAAIPGLFFFLSYRHEAWVSHEESSH